MDYILALFLPGIAVMLKGKIWMGIALILLQLVVLGWIPATIIAFIVINQSNKEKQLSQPPRSY